MAEIPPARPEVTEYRLHRLTCPACGTRTCARLPPGVPAGAFGPRLQAVLALLAGAYRLGKRPVRQLAHDLFGLSISTGMVAKLERSTAAALAQPVDELRVAVRSLPANVDETSWRQGGRRAWLWVAVTKAVTVFRVAKARSAAALYDLVGPVVRRVITSDRYSAYGGLPVRWRQVCWAHLCRDFQAMIDRGNAGAALGAELLSFAEDLFTWWRRVRDGTLSRATLRTYLQQQRAWFRARLAAGVACGCAKTAAVCRELSRVEPALWVFARAEGVEPTNNAAERALRHAVQWRKASYGTDSEVGGQFVGNILSVVATCRQQGRDVLEFLTACCKAAFNGRPPEGLVPRGAA